MDEHCMIENEYEYELIDFTWSLDYDFGEDEVGMTVRDDEGNEEKDAAHIVLDENGIPKGKSMEEIRIRQEIIQHFWTNWRNTHSDQKILNENLHEPILLRSISLIESKEHSAKSYNSTLAILQMEEILAKALPVGRTPVKQGNSNQTEFVCMLVMVYRRKDLGTIKITLGVRHRNKEGKQEKVQYGMTALEPDQTLMPPKTKNKNKKKKAPHE